MTVPKVNQSNNKAAKLRDSDFFLFLFPLEQRIGNAGDDYQVAGRCR